MANDTKGKRKVYFMKHAPGEPSGRNVSGGMFTKKIRGLKAKKAHSYLVAKEDIVVLKGWKDNLK